MADIRAIASWGSKGGNCLDRGPRTTAKYGPNELQIIFCPSLKCTHEENAPPCGPLWHYWLQSSCNCIRRHWRFHCESVLHPTCLVPCMLNVVQRQGHNTSMCRNWFRCLGLSNIVLCQAYMLSQIVILYVLLLAEELNTQGPSFDEQECSTQGNTDSSK